MGREAWAFDDIVLGALLGAWLGTARELWAVPLTGFMVASSVVAVVFFGRQVVMGHGRARRLAILPAVFAAALIALEGSTRLVLPFSHNLGSMLQGWVHGLAPGRVGPALHRWSRGGLVAALWTLRAVGPWVRVTRVHPRNGRSGALARYRAGAPGHGRRPRRRTESEAGHLDIATATGLKTGCPPRQVGRNRS